MIRLVAEFAAPDALRRACVDARGDGHLVRDAFTPFPVEGLGESLGLRPSRIRLAMLGAGGVVALGAFVLQWWSSVYGYPLNSGGRPLNSWPVFLLVPFEVGVLAAAIGGFVAWLRACGLPRLHDPLFEIPNFERATQDRFFLLAEANSDRGGHDLRRSLQAAGALNVSELRG